MERYLETSHLPKPQNHSGGKEDLLQKKLVPKVSTTSSQDTANQGLPYFTFALIDCCEPYFSGLTTNSSAKILNEMLVKIKAKACPDRVRPSSTQWTNDVQITPEKKEGEPLGMVQSAVGACWRRTMTPFKGKIFSISRNICRISKYLYLQLSSAHEEKQQNSSRQTITQRRKITYKERI